MRKIVSHIWEQIMPAAEHKGIVGKGHLKRVETIPG